MQEINITIEDAEKRVRLAELVREMEANAGFKELILEGYFKENASRLVMLKADKEFQTEDKQNAIDKDILGISVLGEFLRNLKIIGDMAKESLTDHEATRESIRRESM